MDEKAFGSASPGRLVPTTAYDEVVRDGKRELVPVTGLAFLPNPLPPSLDWDRLIGQLRKPLIEAERALARLDGKASQLPNPHLLIGPFTRREARLSSLIEDTIATPVEIALAEAGRTPDRDDPMEVVNYIHALEHGRQSDLPLCHRLFQEMHALLLRNVRGERDKPGQYRRDQNYIGNKTRGFKHARFVPPPPGDPLRSCLDAFERFVNQPPADIPSLIMIALSHYQFEAIHPFNDGNGRLGRLLIVLSLCRSGILRQPLVYMSGHFAAFESEYKNLLLRVSTQGVFKEWIEFVLVGFASQAQEADGRVDRLIALRNQFVASVTGRRASSLLIKLVDSLFDRPVVSVPYVEKLLGISTTAARRHIESLLDKNVLEPLELQGKANWFIANQILSTSESDDVEVTGPSS